MNIHPSREKGSAMILALITITIVAYIATTAFRTAGVKYQTMFQAASWQEAMLGAEAGADIGIANLKSGPSLSNGWTNVSGSLWSYPVADLTHSGTGNNTVKIAVTAEQLQSGWYRIRSTGTCRVPGPARAAFDGRDAVLRKIGMKSYDPITGATVPKDANGNQLAQVSRKVEVIVQKVNSQWDKAIKSKKGIVFQTSGKALGAKAPSASWVDAYDPTDNTKSTGGLYDYDKRQGGADVGMLDSTTASINKTAIMGTAYYNGPALTKLDNVDGGSVTPYTTTIDPVVAPWTVYPSGAVLTDKSSVVAASTSASSPTVVNTSGISVSGGKQLSITAPDSTKTYYITLQVGGGINLSGGSTINIPSNVIVTMYVDGTINLSGGSIANNSALAINCIVNAVSPVPALASPRTVTLSGSSATYMCLNAPDYDLTFSGSGSLCGAIICNSFKASGSGSMHYDLSLNSGGSSQTGYVTASWVEATASGHQK